MDLMIILRQYKGLKCSLNNQVTSTLFIVMFFAVFCVFLLVLSLMDGILVCWGCHNKTPLGFVVAQTEISFLMFPEARSTR